MRGFTIAVCLLLASCADQAADAEKEYEVVDASPLSTYREKCEAARKVQAVYRELGKKDKFELWQLIAAGKCGLANTL